MEQLLAVYPAPVYSISISSTHTAAPAVVTQVIKLHIVAMLG
jgi:hypothetical protein